MYAIIDEVDSVLIDEARTPLIISGPVGDESDMQYRELQRRPSRASCAGRPRSSTVSSAEGERLDGERRHRATRRSSSIRRSSALRRTSGLLKALQEPGVKQLVQRTELDHIADRKLPAAKQQFRDIEERLLFVLDEKGHTVHLTDRGADVMSPSDPDAFVLPDISEEVHRIDHDADARAAAEARCARGDRARLRVSAASG